MQGLDIGSKVKYRGVVVGDVTRITFTYVRYELDKPISQRMRKRNPGQYLGRSLARWRKSVLSIRTCYQKRCGRGRWTWRKDSRSLWTTQRRR